VSALRRCDETHLSLLHLFDAVFALRRCPVHVSSHGRNGPDWPSFLRQCAPLCPEIGVPAAAAPEWGGKPGTTPPRFVKPWLARKRAQTLHGLRVVA
jgi:hypothetical protein